MKIYSNFDLSGHHALRFQSRARYAAFLESPLDIPSLVSFAALKNLGMQMLGAGSNVLLPPFVEGITVFWKETKGWQVHGGLSQLGDSQNSDSQSIVIDVPAGYRFSVLVEETLAAGYYGLENLADIPGTVGAAVYQNIGAYGVEVKEHIVSALVFDRKHALFITLPLSQMAMAYRHSRFKEEKGRFWICSVQFWLYRTSEHPHLHYNALAESLGTKAHPQAIFDWVRATRVTKLPDHRIFFSVGSFFKNPLIPLAKWELLREKLPTLAIYPHSKDGIKISAASLLELSGYERGNIDESGLVRSAQKHALVLGHEGNGTYEALCNYAEKITEDIENRFGVKLEWEAEKIAAKLPLWKKRL